MKNFIIDDQYISDVTAHQNYYYAKDPDNPTPNELVTILKNGTAISGSSISYMDHPEFTKLREELGELKYIEIQRGWWNGDSVLKPFTVNGYKFKKNDQFSCAGALSISIKLWRDKTKY